MTRRTRCSDRSAGSLPWFRWRSHHRESVVKRIEGEVRRSLCESEGEGEDRSQRDGRGPWDAALRHERFGRGGLPRKRAWSDPTRGRRGGCVAGRDQDNQRYTSQGSQARMLSMCLNAFSRCRANWWNRARQTRQHRYRACRGKPGGEKARKERGPQTHHRRDPGAFSFSFSFFFFLLSFPVPFPVSFPLFFFLPSPFAAQPAWGGMCCTTPRQLPTGWPWPVGSRGSRMLKAGPRPR